MSLLTDLIYDIHQTSLQPERWPSVMRAISNHLGAHAGTINVLGDEDTQLIEAPFDPDLLKLYHDHYWQDDMWLHKATRLTTGEVSTGMALHPSSEFPRGFQNDILRPLGMHDALGCVAYRGGGKAVNIAYFRRSKEELFGTGEIEFLAELARHMEQALHLCNVFNGQLRMTWALDEALFRSELPTFLVDERLLIVWRNRAGDEFLEKNSGRKIDVRKNRLLIGIPQEEDRLQTAISKAIKLGRNGMVAVTRGAQRRPLNMCVLPLNNQLYEQYVRSLSPFGAFGRCLVIVQDPERRIPISEKQLCKLFNLTSRQAAIARAASQGLMVRDICGRFAMSVETVEDELADVLARLGVRNEAEMASLLSGYDRQFSDD